MSKLNWVWRVLPLLVLATGGARAESLVGTYSFTPASAAPNCVAVNPLTNRTYITLSGTTPVKLAVFDGASLTPVQNGLISFNNGETGPEAIIVNSATNMIYVVCRTGTVVAVDGSTNTITQHITVGSNPVAAALNPVSGKMYVANFGDNNVTVIDTKNNNATSGPIAVGSAPSAIGVNPATNKIFVANSGVNSVSVIDGTNDTALPDITGVSSPFALAVNPSNNTVYVAGVNTGTANEFVISGNGPFSVSSRTSASSRPTAVTVNPLTGKAYFGLNNGDVEICRADLSLISTQVVGSNTVFDLAVNTTANKVYVSTIAATFFMAVLDGNADTFSTFVVIPASQAAPIAVNTATNRAYMLNPFSGNGQAFMIDCAENATAPAAAGVKAAKFAASTDGARVYALDPQNPGNGTLRVLDGQSVTGAELCNVSVGVNSQDLQLNALTGETYVSNKGDNTVMAFNTALPPVPTTINVGVQPGPLAINPNLNRIYVVNTGLQPNTGSVSVINGANKTVLATLPAPSNTFPALVAVNPVNNKFYLVSRGAGQGLLTIYNSDNSVAQGNPPPLSGNPSDIAVDPVNNRVFISYTDTPTVDIVDGNTNTVQLGVTVNTVANNQLAIDAVNGRLYVFSPTSDKYRVVSTFDPTQAFVSNGSAGASVTVTGAAINPITNRAYFGLNTNQVVTIDGGTAGTSTITLSAGPVNGMGVNLQTGRVYAGGNPLRVISVENTGQSGPIASLAPSSFSGLLSYDAAPTFTSNGNPAGLTLYYQVDTLAKGWQPAAAGAAGAFSVALSSLTPGTHTLYTFATDTNSATLYTTGNDSIGHGSTLTVGKITSYTFLVHTGPAPTIDAPTPLTINEDSGSHTINLTGITAGPLSGAPNLTVTALSSNGNIIANPLNVSLNSAAGTASFSFTPVADAFGPAQVLITVTDNNPSTPASFKTASVVLNVTVNPVNDPPTFTVGADITVTEAPVAQTVSNFTSNVVLGPANESTQHILQYIVTAATPDQFLVQPAISTAGTLTFTPANRADAAVPINITVQLQDDGGTANGGQDTSAPVIFHITLTPIADTLIVKNTADVAPPATPVPDSLRDCMARARSSDTITFDPDVFALDNSDAATVINTRADLPHLNRGNITIDASNRRVTINGSAAGSCNGITIESSSNKLYNLSIINFQSSGISVGPNASSNTIGGNRNVGTGVNGQGLRLAGNGAFGINLTGPNTTGNVIEGCWIGLDAGGLQSQANLAGIILQAGAAENTIGGSTDGEGNVISGNFFEGITVSGAGSDNNSLVGNVIGASAVTASASTRSVGTRDDTIGSRSAVANGSAGMFISRGTQSTKAGGANAGEGNTIANNGGNGVEVRTTNSIKNSVRGNSIGKNKRGGITLYDGSNNGIKSPTISQVLTISGRSGAATAPRSSANVRVIGTSSTTGTIEIFNDSSDQGSLLLGRSSVGSDLTFSADVSADLTQNITATVTDDSGNTSSFAVFSASGSGAVDSDGDGFPDDLELALGSDPNDASSTPFNGNAAGTPQSLSNVTLAAKLNFAKTTGNDSLTFSATLNVGSASLANQTVVVDVGGIVRSFTLDANGKSTTKGLTLGKPKNGMSKLILKLTKDTLASNLSDEGLTGDADIKTAVSKTVDVIVLFNQTYYSASKTVLYTARKGVSGAAR